MTHSLRPSRQISNLLYSSVTPRTYSTEAPKASVKLIAEIRKRIEGTSLTKAREALQATNNDLQAALEWLEKDIAVSGAAKAAKLQGRTTGEGLIALAILGRGGWNDKGRPQGVRAAMIELNCETDFVARNSLFVDLAQDVAYSAAYLTEPSSTGDGLVKQLTVDALSDAPMMSSNPSAMASPVSISESIRNGIAKLGEKISLRRVCALVSDPLQDPTLGLAVSSYVHGGVSGTSAQSTATILQAGRMGSLVALGLRSGSLQSSILSTTFNFNEDLSSLGRSLAMQVAGLNASSIRGSNRILEQGNPEASALYDQPFMMRMGAPTEESVGKVLKDWAGERNLVKGGEVEGGEGVEVVEFQKWAVGEPIDEQTA
ncbi:Elongation factor Ts, mitochondrial [Tulasnella sp. 427]|nr:Elongation factor Ts, mitochondrial [Tulasnella sp. 427]